MRSQLNQVLLHDEEINQATTGATGKVVEWDSTNKILYYTQTRHNDAGVDADGNLTAFSGANVITGQGGSSLQAPLTLHQQERLTMFRLLPGYSSEMALIGDVIYIENRTTIQKGTPNLTETENIKLVIEFLGELNVNQRLYSLL